MSVGEREIVRLRREVESLRAALADRDRENGGLRGERNEARAALAAEREAHAETKRAAERSLVVPCACGRPMPSVSSRLRCDACRAEASCAEMRGTIPALLRYVEGRAEHEGPYDEGRCVRGAGCAVCDVERAMESDAGAALLAERDALRERAERAEAACAEMREACVFQWSASCRLCGRAERNEQPIAHREDCILARTDVGSAFLAEGDALRATVERLERVREAAVVFCDEWDSGSRALAQVKINAQMLRDALHAAKDGG